MKAVSAPLIVAAAAGGAVADASSAQAPVGRATHASAPPITIADIVPRYRFMVASFPGVVSLGAQYPPSTFAGHVDRHLTTARARSILNREERRARSKIVDEKGTTPLDQCRNSSQYGCRGRVRGLMKRT